MLSLVVSSKRVFTLCEMTQHFRKDENNKETKNTWGKKREMQIKNKRFFEEKHHKKKQNATVFLSYIFAK